MIELCNSFEDQFEAENYIEKQYFKSLYLYLDLKKYGINNDNVKCWKLQDNGEITALVLKYYTGMHIFSKNKNSFVGTEIIDLIKEENPTIICAEKWIIEVLSKKIGNDYKEEYGWVRELSKIDNELIGCVNKASKEELKQVAKLLYEDEDIGSSYKLEELEKQMIERNEQKFVRNYVIKNENNEVISHAGTGAEDEKLAMLSYVITHPEYRGRGLAKKVCKAVCYDLINEGKKV